MARVKKLSIQDGNGVKPTGVAKRRRRVRKPSNLKKSKPSNTHGNTPTSTSATYKRRGHFAFLDLPAELRDNIYNKILENEPIAHLSRNTSRRTLAVVTPLALVNRQVRSEFLHAATIASPIIQTTVRDFQFGHIITFLNRLSEVLLKRLETQDAMPQRTIEIDLILTQGGRNEALRSGLERWLNRMGTEKKGAKIEYRYTYEGSRAGGEHPNPGSAGSRQYEEKMKICRAISKAPRVRW